MKGGPAAAVVLVLAVLLMTTPTGRSGFTALSDAAGGPSAWTASLLAAAWPAVAASGTWFGTIRIGRSAGAEPETAMSAVLVTLALVLAGLLVSFVTAGDWPAGNALLAMVALTAGALAGVGVARVALPRPSLTPAVLAATAGLLLALAARFVLARVLAPDVFLSPSGAVTADAAAAFRELDRWSLVASGCAAGAAGVLGARLVPRGPGSLTGLLLVAFSPLLLRAAGVGLGSIWAGTTVWTAVPEREWLYLFAGGLAGTVVAAVLPGRPRAPERSAGAAPVAPGRRW
ncbi:hypothetical protein [Actinomadura sp. 6K520]|uniref:hypothetical protein n=1 Tax=Actinomadura sp. 6K520 TaxID=2530364 RepID=UPI001051A553|nr:hypothetical protein [Actinomadura sp. 6K520]TDE33403.1 hypothetical protein E1289_12740 [Actinomadura sp. 6K520]